MKQQVSSHPKLRTVSISITVRNAFSDRPEIGARKLPAAPDQWPIPPLQHDTRVHSRRPQWLRLTADDKVDLPIDLNTPLRRCFEGLGLPDINGLEHAFAPSCIGELFRSCITLVLPRVRLRGEGILIWARTSVTHFRPKIKASAPCFI